MEIATNDDWSSCGQVKDDWEEPVFRVVDAGRGRIALHNFHFNRFIKMDGDGTVKARGVAAVWYHIILYCLNSS